MHGTTQSGSRLPYKEQEAGHLTHKWPLQQFQEGLCLTFYLQVNLGFVDKNMNSLFICTKCSPKQNMSHVINYKW